MMSLQMRYIFVTILVGVYGQAEDRRCKCVCPSLAAVFNHTISSSDRKLFIANVPPNKCDCDNVILPRVADDIKGLEQEYCPLCQCKNERRNTTVIKVVVIIVLWILTLLVVYMGFLVCLNPLIKIKKLKLYQKASSEEVQNLLNSEDLED